MTSDYFELDLTSDANPLELEYREKIQLMEYRYNDLQKWYNLIQYYCLDIIPFLENKGIVFSGRILELGAGSCWCASELSKLEDVRQIYALDFSRTLLTEVAPTIMMNLDACMNKIIRVRGDFYDLNYFSEDYFDFVIYDAALHHAMYPQKTLLEARRVLRKNGSIICIREPVLPQLTPFKEFWKIRFGTHEKGYGVIENSYTLAEWKLIFHNAKLTFSPILLPNVSAWKQAASRLLNNLKITSYCFEGKLFRA